MWKPETIRRNIAALGSGNIDKEVRAENYLIRTGPACIPELLAACHSEVDEVRARCAWILGKAAVPETFADLCRLARDPNPEVAYDALVALGHFGDERALPLLEEVIETDQTGGALTGGATTALLRFGAPALPSASRLISSFRTLSQLAGIAVLEKADSAHVEPLLRELIASPDPDVRIAAEEALKARNGDDC